MATSQDVLGRTVKTQEVIGELAKSQFEAVAQKAQATAETAQSNFAKAAKAAAPKSSVK